MQLRWTRAKPEDRDVLLIDGVWKLQVGYWELAGQEDNGHGGKVDVMELRWHDIPVDR